MAILQPLIPRAAQALLGSIGAPTNELGDPVGRTNELGDALPAIEAPPAPTTPLDPLVARTNYLNADIDKRTAPRPAATTALGKIGHVAAGIGNVLGDIFAPDTMALIPGTQLHNERILARDKADLEQTSQEQTAQAQRAQTAATTAYETARPEIEQNKITQKLTSTLGAKGLIPERDDNGALTGNVVEDPNNPAAQSRQIHDAVEQSRQNLQDAEAQVKLAGNDPNSPTYKLAITRAEIAKENANAAITRAQAYYANYLQHAYNKDAQGNILPGAPQIQDAAGNTTTVGSTNAGQAVKAQANVAQFNDVIGSDGALANIENKAKALESAGGRLNSPAVVYALQHSHGTPGQVVQSIDKANLTPEERDYVVANISFHDNLQALRKSSGGTASDSSIDRLEAMAPDGSTPDVNYLLKQTGQIRQTGSRLAKGVTTVSGGQKVSDQPNRKYNPATGKIE